MGYTSTGTYSPTITNVAGVTTLAHPISWVRWGVGPGPKAGDQVRVIAHLSSSVTDPVTAAICTFPPPFVMADAATHATATRYNQTDTTPQAEANPTTGPLVFSQSGLTTALSPKVSSAGYDFITENAVDP